MEAELAVNLGRSVANLLKRAIHSARVSGGIHLSMNPWPLLRAPVTVLCKAPPTWPPTTASPVPTLPTLPRLPKASAIVTMTMLKLSGRTEKIYIARLITREVESRDRRKDEESNDGGVAVRR